MKNNLLGVHWDQGGNMEGRLPVYSDLLDLMVMDKLQSSDNDGVPENLSNPTIHDCDHECDECDSCEDCDDCDDCVDELSGPWSLSLLDERLGLDLMWENSAHKLLTAGYTDCMDEAIRFLIEEEKISPDHPVVRNLRDHLVESRDRILQEAKSCDLENNNGSWDSLRQPETCKTTERGMDDLPVLLVNCQSSWNTG